MPLRRLMILAACVLVSRAAAALDMQLEPVFTAGRFDFTRKTADVAESPPRFNEQMSGSTEHYDIWMAPDGVAEVPQYDYFTYEIYVRPRANPSQVTHFNFQGRANAPFDDQMADVSFRIIDGAVSEEGKINLPIFGAGAPDVVLTSHQQEEPYDVHLATEKEIVIPITNELKKMGVMITAASASPNDPAMWTLPIEVRKASRGFTPFLLRNGATDNTDLRIKLDPRTQHALTTSLIRGRSKDDDVINVMLTCKTLGREEKTVPIDVHVKFVPWPPFLLLVTLAGSLFGWLLLLLVKAKKEDWGERLRILGSAAAAAVLIEVFGMLMVLGKSELKILDFTLDPFQMPTAALIGVLAGLAGYKSREFLLSISQADIFRLGGTRKPDAAA